MSTVRVHVASVDGRHDGDVEMAGVTTIKYAAARAGEALFGTSEPPDDRFRFVLCRPSDWRPLPDEDLISEHAEGTLLLGVVEK